jgi:hypothetical protein
VRAEIEALPPVSSAALHIEARVREGVTVNA